MNCVKILSTRSLAPLNRQRLEEKGFELEEQSFIQIKYSLTAEAISRLEHITAGEVVAFTSANAVEAVKEHFPQFPVKVYCISGTTRQAVETLFSDAVIAATAPNGKELAEKILASDAEKLLLICGNLRRDELPAILRAQGIEVEELVVYHTIETPVALKGDFEGVLFFSPSAVKSFFSLNELPAAAVCFAIGDTTAAAVREHCSNTVIAAPFPSQEAMVAEVEKYFGPGQGR